MAENCIGCGVELTELNSWLLPEEVGGNVPWCPKCQQKWFRYLRKHMDAVQALHLCCLFFHVPYREEFLPGDLRGAVWTNYVGRIQAAGWMGDGTDEVRLGNTLSTPSELHQYDPFNSAWEIIESEPDNKEELLRLREKWNDPGGELYVGEDYRLLEKVYAAMTEGRPDRTAQQEEAIRKVCILELEQARCLKSREYADAQRIGMLIKMEKESELLRKKDEQEPGAIRIDDIVKALHRRGIEIDDYDKLCHQLANYTFHKTYPYTRDAADRMILAIRNTTAASMGMPQIDTLEESDRMRDPLGEFAETMPEGQREVYRAMGILKGE